MAGKKVQAKGTIKVVPKAKVKRALRPSSGLLTEKISVKVKKQKENEQSNKSVSKN